MFTLPFTSRGKFCFHPSDDNRDNRTSSQVPSLTCLESRRPIWTIFSFSGCPKDTGQMVKQRMRFCLSFISLHSTIQLPRRSIINCTLCRCIVTIVAAKKRTVGLCDTCACRPFVNTASSLFSSPPPGHTKNLCDGSFVLFKKLLNSRDMNSTSEMMLILHNSSSTSLVIDESSVQWTDWNLILSAHFIVPKKVEYKLILYLSRKARKPWRSLCQTVLY